MLHVCLKLREVLLQPLLQLHCAFELSLQLSLQRTALFQLLAKHLLQGVVQLFLHDGPHSVGSCRTGQLGIHSFKRCLELLELSEIRRIVLCWTDWESNENSTTLLKHVDASDMHRCPANARNNIHTKILNSQANAHTQTI